MSEELLITETIMCPKAGFAIEWTHCQYCEHYLSRIDKIVHCNFEFPEFCKHGCKDCINHQPTPDGVSCYSNLAIQYMKDGKIFCRLFHWITPLPRR